MSEVRSTFKNPEEVREFVVPLLKDGVAVVNFVKKNGETRSMSCTLKSDLLPKVEVNENTEKSSRKVNNEVLAVYDVNANGWRSFRLDSVTSVEFGV